MLSREDKSPCRPCEKYLVKGNKRCRLKCQAMTRYLDALEQDSLVRSSAGGLSYSILITVERSKGG